MSGNMLHQLSLISFHVRRSSIIAPGRTRPSITARFPDESHMPGVTPVSATDQPQN